MARSATPRSWLRAWLQQSLQNRIAFVAFCLAGSVLFVAWSTAYVLVAQTTRDRYHAEQIHRTQVAARHLAALLNQTQANLLSFAGDTRLASDLADPAGRSRELESMVRTLSRSLPVPAHTCLADSQGNPLSCQDTTASQLADAPPPSPSRHERWASLRQADWPARGELRIGVPVAVAGQPIGADLLVRIPIASLLLAIREPDDEPDYRLVRRDEASPEIPWYDALRGIAVTRASLDLAPPLDTIALAIERQAAGHAWRGEVAALSVFFLGVALVLLGLAAWGARQAAARLTARLERLTHRAERGSRGEPVDFSVAPLDADEVGRLGDVYGRLVTRLQEANARLENKIAERTRALRKANSRLEESRARLSFALEANQEGVWDWDIPSGVVLYSRRWLEILGYDEADIGHGIADWEQLLHPDDRGHAMAALARHEEPGRPYLEQEFRMRAKDGGYRWVRCRGKVVARDRQGNALRVVGTQHDFTTERQAVDALELAHQVFESIHESLLITDADNNIVSANPAFTAITGYTFDEVRGRNPRLLQSGLQPAGFYRELWEKLAAAGRWQGELWNRRKSGEFFAAHLSIVQIRSPSGEVERHFAVMRDVTEAKEHEAALLHQANHDALTGLPNRRLATDRLDQAIARARRDRQRLALLLIDLDGFKAINDSLGHKAGDLLLQQVAARLRQAVRESDTVARLGGDEFLVLLTQIENELDAQRVAEKILEALCGRFDLDGRDAFVSGSVGITTFPDDGNTADELMIYADTAMYEAKRGGKNTFRFFTRSLQQQARLRIEIENELRRALTRDEFALQYQPLVTLAGQRVVGAEVLLRWHHPEHGELGPDSFLAVAEETGLIRQIGQLVLSKSLAQLLIWRPMLPAGFRLGINLSPAECQADNLEVLHARLSSEPEVAAHLQFEVTERIDLAPSGATAHWLSRLQALGVRIVIDDFGTGHSPLTRLQAMPATGLKIDRSFVADLEHSPSTRAMVEAILSVCRSLSLSAIAEGVESPAQAAFLFSRGCDLGQGRLFGEPCAASEFSFADLPAAAAARTQPVGQTA